MQAAVKLGELLRDDTVATDFEAVSVGGPPGTLLSHCSYDRPQRKRGVPPMSRVNNVFWLTTSR